jgi:transposase-like protein
MRRYRSESEWQIILEDYSRSGQSVESFCKERGVCKSSIYRRTRKTDKRDGEFVELPRPVAPLHYEISIKGVTLRIPSSERADKIAELVRAVAC